MTSLHHVYECLMKFSNVLARIRVFAISTCHRKLSWRKSEIPRTLIQAKNGTSLFRLLLYISRKVDAGLSVPVAKIISTLHFFFGLKTMTRKIAMQLYSSIMLVTVITIVSTISATVTINHGPWAEVLENWITLQSNNSRTGRVMKVDDKLVTVTTKIQNTSNKREVTETDLYLLGAIEKLVYRVDHLEKRVRRAEELLYYVIAGNNKMKEPCPANYTRMGQNCYHFSNREFNWKSSASLCRGMGGHLVEFDTIEESQDVIAGLTSDAKLKGKNFWTGGLNPGLLWIWASSARPVHQDTKQPVIGDGRCLKLTFNASSKIYSYRGEDCGSRQRYLCELTVDDESTNRIERTARLLIDKNN
ncbi:C-type lectin domain family 12 member B isoform X2 [Monomorium pharaonis]|uniref:C-type lectin domain family 12 member B isoform X2 n=1 Tax=Monomorium pharaonis TaxID=307658 RepID=UPI0017471E14|nr:C-type lectin domain family 12 member B isoform X2 [Monomorium pharaonis]